MIFAHYRLRITWSCQPLFSAFDAFLGRNTCPMPNEAIGSERRLDRQRAGLLRGWLIERSIMIESEAEERTLQTIPRMWMQGGPGGASDHTTKELLLPIV
jgi:hypothetical protein